MACVEMTLIAARGRCGQTFEISIGALMCLNLVVQEVPYYTYILIQNLVFKILTWNSKCIFLREIE